MGYTNQDLRNMLETDDSMQKLASLCWIEHSSGSWKVGVGDTFGTTVRKTSGMGMTIGLRHPIDEFIRHNPSMAEIAMSLLLANEKQLRAELLPNY